LAAVVSLKAASENPTLPVKFQILIVPVIDNTATTATLWAGNANAPWLTPARMLWYRNMYLPNESDWSSWDASPNFAPSTILAKSPRTWIGIAELDILCEEGKLYAQALERQGVSTNLVEYAGSTHSVLILDGVLDIGKKLVEDVSIALLEAFSL
jgi:acetyl esterase/lipase